MVGRTDPSNSDNQNGDGGGLVYACARVCVHACVCLCVRACMRACMHACVRPGVRASGRACVMCLQYTIITFDPG